ncbi:tetratricopeptide repeat protein [Glycomyces sp. TRM65418]|uniref:AfsR/SARP family transcriptional regulator n=1 Tax=Glycomyces sp. TRM65418 TaxID=2867006 RepID=UPI001CE57AB3|nr:BTAD domain-containing putative transcriptional regulator [Glycomyces sp. TRM65418]MCC3763993.1 tetratricopeptide repeat protein [Glycomyces sp. TRM65418]QZD53689.1 tetratricopeptide repeat protein [Glycomyces sp. TRM65418]
MTETIRIGLLGPFQVTVEGLPKAVDGGRQRAVLAALALAAGKPVRSSALAALVWGEDDQATRHRLHAIVNRLRQVLGPDVIRTAAGEYTLDLEPEAVDLHRFRALVAESKRVEGAAELAALDRALALWRGDPLADIDAESLTRAHVPTLTEERLRALERRADLVLDAGGHAELVAELNELTNEHPLREFLWSRLMLALHRSGRQAEALAAYQRVRTLLADRLGIDPGEELQAVHRTVLRPGSGPRPAEAVAAPATAPVAAPAPRQLAIDIAGFTGRAARLSELDRLLDTAREPGRRPVAIAVISGPAGVGKTALAVHWAHRVADRFPDGQLHVNLSGRWRSGSAADAALMTLLLSLGTPPQQIPPDTDGRSAALRTALAGRRVLMLLDNARDADQVRPLLPGSDSLVVITSRNRLRSLRRREGAHLMELDPFTPAESTELLRRVLGPEAVSSHPGAIAELTDLCGHLPLAVALAAERVRNTGIDLPMLVEQARDDTARLDALDDGADDVRKVFSWSYQALPEQAAMMFRTLGTAPGPDVGVEAAAALAGAAPPVALRLLESLVDHNLLTRPRPGRYELHDLLRVYAAELATAVDGEHGRTAALARLLDWYIATGLGARSHVQPTSVGLETPRTEVAPLAFADAPSALRWFETEQDNLIAAVSAAASTGLDRHCWQLVHLLWVHLDRCRAWPEIASLGATGLAAARRTGDRYAEAEMLSMGASLRHLGRFDEAIDTQRRALRLYRDMELRSDQASVLNNLGMIFRSMGRHEDAIDYLRRCVALDEEADEPGDLAVSLLNLAQAYIEAGRAAEAIETAERSLELLRGLSHRRGQGRAMDTIGRAHGQLGDHGAAASWLRRASDVFADIGDRWYQSGSLTSLGRELRAHGSADEAAEVLERALELATAVGDPRAEEIRGLLEDRGDSGPGADASGSTPERALQACAASEHAKGAPGEGVAGRP